MQIAMESSDSSKQQKKGNGKPAASRAAASSARGNGPLAPATKKKKMVRLTREQVDRILAYKPKQFPEAPQCSTFPQHLQDTINAAFESAAAALVASQANMLKEQEWVRSQIQEKGYAEYEVDAGAPRLLRRVGQDAVAQQQTPRNPVKHAVGLGVRKTF
ncbi:hypothetical protein ACP70R_049561 [Stipagrostis hirtigluma subsp. patula]